MPSCLISASISSYDASIALEIEGMDVKFSHQYLERELPDECSLLNLMVFSSMRVTYACNVFIVFSVWCLSACDRE